MKITRYKPAQIIVMPAAIFIIALGSGASCLAQVMPATKSATAFRPELIYQPKGNFENQTARPLRYWPVGGDFVITNGVEFFNRPLYCVNSGFRIDGGDKPEFSLYLPGRGGNLRFGIKTSAGVKWLNDAQQIVARYRSGSLLYAIRDPLLGDGELDLTVLPLSETKGVVARAELHGTTNSVELIFAFGGANGMKGSRNGDIGCEREPVSEFFQLRPEQCQGNEFSIAANTFLLDSKVAKISGVATVGTKFAGTDAKNWSSLKELLALVDKKTDLPVVVGQSELQDERPCYLVLEQISGEEKSASAENLPKLFSAAEEHRRAIAGRVLVETPDPFINAAAAALNIAADAVWDDKQQSFMHGAVAWRTRLLGWRGQYAGDELGWHERTAAHFAGFAKQQNTSPIPETIPPADEQFNLARSEAAVHSNGDMSKNHYDMNLVAVDAFFRHLLWTGDTNYARQMWPVIERHLAWERRLFRREFGPDKLPLYEAYAAIWASDDLNYNGGGTAHASAYNYFANKMAARVAKILGEYPAIYEREAGLILRGMNKYLWLADEGNFAECKDMLGLQLVHPNSGLWTFYHTLDSEVPTPTEAWQMSRWVDANIAHIPVQISGSSRREEALTEKSEIDQSLLTSAATETNLYTLPETSWMPYTWSLNNVVVAEAVHTSLGFWQANRRDAAFPLFKGALLDTMFLGLCPGNVGAMTYYDMARGEAQRDFADGIGVTSRALIEGLFGVKPDALAGELRIEPGFPAEWNRASIRHPDFNFSFQRGGLRETFSVEPKFPKPMALRLQIAALRDGVASVTVNDQPAKWRVMEELVGESRVEIQGAAAGRSEVVVEWKGGVVSPQGLGLRQPSAALDQTATREKRQRAAAVQDAGAIDWRNKIPDAAKLETVNLASVFNDKVTQIFRNEYRAPRSPFVSLATPKQGVGGWCEPNASFDVDDSGLRAIAAKSGGKIGLPNGVTFATPGEAGAKNIVFTSQWDNYPHEVSIPLSGKSSHAFLLMAGSTSAMQSRFDNGEVIVTYADGTTERLALRNPTTWWPIEQDYFMDDFAFRRDEPVPPRVDLKTGKVRVVDVAAFKGRGGKVPGGAATVLDLPLDKSKKLKSLTVRALANEVVVGLMGVTLKR
ncbi:MAG TPA: DUF4450 domain-containing protein [Candidatus Limnocylindrales bacterium]|nr:DUF4450 domain-containing protein [Candidatus Limnocylindrales bacterium]